MEVRKTIFPEFLTTLTEDDRSKIEAFFSEFEQNFSIPKKDTRKFRYDFEQAIIFLVDSGISVSEVLSRLALSNLGGFYARSSILWFPLDDAAKIYPIAMEHGAQSLFRIAIYLKNDVVPELLQMALTFTLKRFPCFATTLKRGFFWHYLDSAKKHFPVEKENGIPCRPIKVSLSGSMPFRVMYYNNRISLEFFHALTDGAGAIAFLKSLVSEYLRLNGITAAESSDIWNVNDTPAIEEFENAFAKVERSKHSTGLGDKPAVQMNGKLSKIKPCRILHFKMDAKKLYEVAKDHGATVTAYLLMQMFYACQASTDVLKGDLNIQVPVNMRKFYPSKTVRNFSMYCGIRIPIESISDNESMIAEINTQLTEKASKEKMQEMVTGAVKLVRSIRGIPLFIKQPLAKIVYGFMSEKVDTTTLSNLGVVKFPPELAEHIESMDCYIGAQLTNRLSCAIITSNNVATFSISKMTADSTFEQKIYELLTADGIEIEAEGSEYYGH